ncbi:MAG: RecQ family ATP-dependent DNA helicase [Planctomycetota bacterium]|nr:MAG: RecQ family ATP-dependent DNA helicase [Planctomycetota bacterium]
MTVPAQPELAFEPEAQPPAPVAAAADALAALRAEVARVFGIGELRPFQEEAIRANLAGRDLLLVLPTGGGKSLCFQAPALVRRGLTLVVSPLIALMKDQVDGLCENGVAAAMLTSAQETDERRAVHAALERGDLRLLYVSPERLAVDGFVERLVALGLAAIAIDEAHCISHWGHDFRPEYRQLGRLRARAPGIPLHAYTATADERVRADILSELGLVDPLVLVAPCDRPNLVYRVQPRRELSKQLREVLERHRGEAGIVYCISRKEVERVDAELRAAGFASVAYHAGLTADRRKRAQDDFANERVDIVVATVAFGMGIDRTDVRFVVHAALPKGLEQYSQETGRAGRDGLAAECVLFHSGADYFSWKTLMERSHEEARAAGDEPDATALERSLDRLGEMRNFTTRFVCRHKQLVEHFGQAWTTPGGCEACDVCLGEIALAPDSTILAQKILSAVVRCQQRYGAAHVTDVLRGAETEAMRRTGHDQLSTYGLLRANTVAEVRAWIDQLVGQDLLRISGDQYPILVVSPTGSEVLKRQREVVLYALPVARPKRTRGATRSGPLDGASDAASGGASDAAASSADPALFDRLRALRRALARERGVPPYLIFNDRTLEQMATSKPRTVEEFRAVKGVGDKKAADLGPAFLACIAGEG